MLVATDWLTTATEALEYIEAPYKYEPERDLWIAHQRPCPYPGWAAFTEAMTRRGHGIDNDGQ